MAERTGSPPSVEADAEEEEETEAPVPEVPAVPEAPETAAPPAPEAAGRDIAGAQVPMREERRTA